MTGAVLILIGLVGAAVILLSIGDSIDSSGSPQVEKLAQAIASAEGFYVSGSRASRNHNPGDMTQDLIGKGIGMDGPFVIYGSDADGFANLFAQINKWLRGESPNATAESTISDLSHFYTTDNQASWAMNVANAAGVSIDTPIGAIS